MNQPSSEPVPSANQSPELRWYGWTDRGKIRRNNEDSFVGLQFDAREIQLLGKNGQGSTLTTDFVFAVSDGMGGALAGEYASRIAVERITTILPPCFKQSAAGLESGFGDVLTELFDKIHRALVFVGRSYEECSGMETTLSLCWFTPGWVYHAHIGDSRIYYLPNRDRSIKQLTQDDTHVGWLFRNGKINEREARTHPRRNVLQKALGGGNQFVDPQLGAVAYERGDLFVLCSDGLVEGLYNNHILSLLRPEPHEVGLYKRDNPARLVVEQAVKNDGRDNVTAWVIEVL